MLTDDGATEFRLLLAPLRDGWVDDPDEWRELVAENPAERLHAVDAFASHLVLSLRRDGRPLLRVLDARRHAGARHRPARCRPGRIALGRNELFDAAAVTVVEESYVQPPVWTDVDLAHRRTHRAAPAAGAGLRPG